MKKSIFAGLGVAFTLALQIVNLPGRLMLKSGSVNNGFLGSIDQPQNCNDLGIVQNAQNCNDGPRI